ncbi:hypothetical protein WUBG_00323 [Wuchereria bancrofti]|uniref:Uncharacterized protein n=1 Tax=Wuchereria bancrofti TaxID=6293 RepID=J9BMI9_WUCBA|nr:hypothetical protein WUBG_00323 [Wuchereria bancrofti]
MLSVFGEVNNDNATTIILLNVNKEVEPTMTDGKKVISGEKENNTTNTLQFPSMVRQILQMQFAKRKMKVKVKTRRELSKHFQPFPPQSSPLLDTFSTEHASFDLLVTFFATS